MSPRLACISLAVVYSGDSIRSVFGLDIPPNNVKPNNPTTSGLGKRRLALYLGLGQQFKNAIRNPESFSALPSSPRELQPRGHRLAALLPEITSAFHAGRR